MEDNAKVLEDAKKKMNVLIQKSLTLGAKKNSFPNKRCNPRNGHIS